MGDMPDMDAPMVKSFTKSTNRANILNRSRLNSSARAAGTMRQSFQRLHSTAGGGSGSGFDSQVGVLAHPLCRGLRCQISVPIGCTMIRTTSRRQASTYATCVPVMCCVQGRCSLSGRARGGRAPIHAAQPVVSCFRCRYNCRLSLTAPGSFDAHFDSSTSSACIGMSQGCLQRRSWADQSPLSSHFIVEPADVSASQRHAVLERLTSDAGRRSEDVLISGRSFENAVIDRVGSSVFAARLFESQNSGAGDLGGCNHDVLHTVHTADQGRHVAAPTALVVHSWHPVWAVCLAGPDLPGPGPLAAGCAF